MRDPMFQMVLMFGALILGMYFLMIRPQQKRARQQQTMLNSIGEGARVLLTSGIFATVKHMGEKQVIVEIAPDSEITILRQAIMRLVNDDEEEFEYTDTDNAELSINPEPVIDPIETSLSDKKTSTANNSPNKDVSTDSEHNNKLDDSDSWIG